MMRASSPLVGGAIMLTKQKLSRIADVALLSLLVLEAVFVTAGIASAQAADAQAQTDSFVSAPQQPNPDATSGRTLHSTAPRGAKGWIALHRPDGEVVYIKLEQIVFVMSAKNTGADQRVHSKIQLLNGHSDVRDSVEEVMQIIENDRLLAKDGT
jgi:hypothetical protein